MTSENGSSATANPRTPVQFRAWPPTFAPTALRLASQPRFAKVAAAPKANAQRSGRPASFAKPLGFVIAASP